MRKSKTTLETTNETIGNYKIKQVIGEGTFSKVKLGINKITKEKVAIKILEKSKIIEKDDLERIFREMKIIKQLNHENIVKVYDVFENNEYYFIIMDYCEGGELFDYIVKKERLKEEEAAYFFYQIINALEYIHSKGIVHRDLKPENLLLKGDNILKIIDFGLSNYFNGKKLLITPCGSPCYASPEMVSGNKYNGFDIDIWAIGIILYAMLCGYLPFEDDDNNILFQKILECNLEIPDFLSELSIDILHKILEVNPHKRIKIEDIKKHKFYLLGKEIFNKKFINKNDFSDEKDFNRINSDFIISVNKNGNNNIFKNENFDLYYPVKTTNRNYEDSSNNNNYNLFTEIHNLKINNNTKILKNIKQNHFKMHNIKTRNFNNNDLFTRFYSKNDNNVFLNNHDLKKKRNLKIFDNGKIILAKEKSNKIKMNNLNNEKKKLLLLSDSNEKKYYNPRNKFVLSLKTTNVNNFKFFSPPPLSPKYNKKKKLTGNNMKSIRKGNSNHIYEKETVVLKNIKFPIKTDTNIEIKNKPKFNINSLRIKDLQLKIPIILKKEQITIEKIK